MHAYCLDLLCIKWCSIGRVWKFEFIFNDMKRIITIFFIGRKCLAVFQFCCSAEFYHWPPSVLHGSHNKYKKLKLQPLLNSFHCIGLYLLMLTARLRCWLCLLHKYCIYVHHDRTTKIITKKTTSKDSS